jgi:hypothetical protein
LPARREGRARVVERAGIDAEVRHVTDYGEIVARGVLSTPGLVIDGKVLLADNGAHP